MKKIISFSVFLLLMSCSSTRFVDSWKNKEITSFNPKKLLVVGMTDNLTARRIFEEEMRLAFIQRGINAFESNGIINEDFTETEKTMEEIEGMTQKLLVEGFDAVVITAVKGVDDRINYRSDYYDVTYRWYRFGRYWYAYQDVYHTPGYYSNYKVYHVETAVYNLTAEENRSLVWVGSFDIFDPQNITSTVDDYVARITEQMEHEGLIDRL
ncbi:hypothetical protein SAMN04487891_11199 [Flagellimonas taeanensis]|jgi:hypothetical protein|uniref:DUF4136 domain-containing protein n=1 Tax=Flagellimonas taeanensis TaxID=1005926 RepID=A0A1M6W9A4_9FLAO|nr:hypothetical protein [Allomuricauda taeanensis]SFC45228.1 hypothetical protein SAMN04487891_11199 [Allomuricauda taeanensis]SHK90311.1 hypothetical protein SAMN05216293_2210 [Allomuricauda taeanensis]